MAWAWLAGDRSLFMSGNAVRPSVQSVTAQDFWRMTRSGMVDGFFRHLGNRRANRRALVHRDQWRAPGLPAYYDVDNVRAMRGVRFGVSLRHPGPEGLEITTRSAAETFFDLPSPSEAGRAQRPSLFSPYWQARLAHVLEDAR